MNTSEHQDAADEDTEQEHAAKLLHDLSTPLLTIDTIAKTLQQPHIDAAQAGEIIDKQVTRIRQRLKTYWHEIETKGCSDTDAERGDSVSISPKPEATPRNTSQCLHCLIIDDDPTHLEIGTRTLIKMGHVVEHATSGASALELCEKKAYNLIIIDQNMPVMDGRTLSYKLRLKYLNRHAYYLVGMSSDPREKEQILACRAAGMNNYISKPISSEKLQPIIEEVTKALAL